MTDTATGALTTSAPTDLDDLTELLRMAGSEEDTARLSSGEIAALIQTRHGWGGLKAAAAQARRKYKTVAGQARVVAYYQSLLPGRTLTLGESIARELLAEFPELTFTDLRVAIGLSKDNPWIALRALRELLRPEMSIEQFEYAVGQERKRNGHTQNRYVIDNGRGIRVTIERY